MPGLVDTHRHCWGSMLRGGACYGNLGDYFGKVVFTYGAAFTPSDNYTSVRLGMAETVSGGITAIHAWEHNLHTPEHARATLQALRESGMRGRFSYGPSARTEDPRSFARAARRSTSRTSCASATRSSPARAASTSASRRAGSSSRRRACGSASSPSPASTACRSRRTR